MDTTVTVSPRFHQYHLAWCSIRLPASPRGPTGKWWPESRKCCRCLRYKTFPAKQTQQVSDATVALSIGQQNGRVQCCQSGDRHARRSVNSVRSRVGRNRTGGTRPGEAVCRLIPAGRRGQRSHGYYTRGSHRQSQLWRPNSTSYCRTAQYLKSAGWDRHTRALGERWAQRARGTGNTFSWQMGTH